MFRRRCEKLCVLRNLQRIIFERAGWLLKSYEAHMNANGTKSRELSAKIRPALYLAPCLRSTAVGVSFSFIKNVCRLVSVLF